MKVLILLSGGIDSACCIAFYQEMGYEVTGVFVNYGQPPVQREEQSANAIAKYYGIPLHTVHSCGPSGEFRGEIPGRNAFLVFAALLYHPIFSGVLALGIHSGTPYYDCSQDFAFQLNKIVAGYRNGKVVLGTPFLTWTKQMVYEFCLERKIPIHLTWSCEVGPSEPCGQCMSCMDREHLNVRAQE
jgi:7-cyano-7-deazaguanine synthase